MYKESEIFQKIKLQDTRSGADANGLKICVAMRNIYIYMYVYFLCLNMKMPNKNLFKKRFFLKKTVK